MARERGTDAHVDFGHFGGAGARDVDGEGVGEMADDPLFGAVLYGQWLLDHRDYVRDGPPELAMAPMIKHLPIIERYAPESPGFREVLTVITEIRTHWKERELGKRNTKSRRRRIRKSYDVLFDKIGRRDGFCCAFCGTVDDLQIDHIIPLRKNGNNDLANLQLLCRTCNLKKSDKAIHRIGDSK